MKKVWHLLFFALFVFVLFLCKPRQDLVFGAMNESQCLRLFEDGKEFRLNLKDNSLYTGTYTILKDTVFLLYQEHLEVSGMKLDGSQTEDYMILPLKLYVDESTSQIVSANDLLFSAEIYLDKRQEIIKPVPVNIRALNNLTEMISAIGIHSPPELLQR